MPDSIPDFGAMSQGQLKVLVEKHGVKMKSGASKEIMVKKLTKNWPFPQTLENFIGAPAPRGTV